MKACLLISLLIGLTACQTYQMRPIPISPENMIRWSPDYWMNRIDPGARDRMQRQLEMQALMFRR